MTDGTELPVWRSLLYVPVNVDRFVDKAHARGADAIQLDLEDATRPELDREYAKRPELDLMAAIHPPPSVDLRHLLTADFC